MSFHSNLKEIDPKTSVRPRQLVKILSGAKTPAAHSSYWSSICHQSHLLHDIFPIVVIIFQDWSERGTAEPDILFSSRTTESPLKL